MSLFFYKIWSWCKKTIFTVKWWKDHWWLPLVFLGLSLLWILTAGRGSSPVIRLSQKINKIKEKERQDISKIKEDAKDKEKDIDVDLEKDKDKVSHDTEKKIDELKERIKDDNEKIKDDSDKINSALNDILED